MLPRYGKFIATVRNSTKAISSASVPVMSVLHRVASKSEEKCKADGQHGAGDQHDPHQPVNAAGILGEPRVAVVLRGVYRLQDLVVHVLLRSGPNRKRPNDPVDPFHETVGFGRLLALRIRGHSSVIVAST